MADRKMQDATEKAYTKSLTTTEYAPEKKDPRTMAKMTAIEKAAMADKVAEERSKGVTSGASDRVFSAGKEALDEQRRETRFKVPELEERAKTAYKTAYKKGGKVSSASSRADGIAQRGKTRGKMV
jgi:hypothetical protein